ncbi:dTDP-4-dehydrorhamnose reductase [Roseinatronobacter sp. S2]|uniref:dTDP-4-dehydrorhamnose reductase n=1 Tax=Roseinatronobacter sp. S2 TaxID=3035471 RepID=UPI00241074A9|nr:dTDP-4-dehydrorhamnose reductase [Roseinatronobacter sp. S2]WFE75027.1 dTDP-4-dehydrorhamnose reductase [Roseinatronobacter sp. S2]
MILVFGRTGQVARELARLVPDATYLGRDQADLSDPEACAAAIRAHNPRAVINAAAYTAVDRAEDQEALAAYINGAAPAAMARECAAMAVPFVHISTDYVFDGSGVTPFAPDHPPAPLGAYGRTKLMGEQGVQAASGMYAILRTSWVFSCHGSNFVRTMLRLGAERDSLRVVADQIGGPTPARAIAQACISIAAQLHDAPEKSGIYHFSGAPDTSWAGFAREIMARAGLDCRIDEITTSDYPTPAQRPPNSRLECSSLAKFGLERPDWRQGLADVLTELKGTP